MQVHDDSQVLVFSPRFDTVAEAVRYTAEQVDQYNARTGDDLALVVKEHPSDYGRIDYRALRESLPRVRSVRTTPVSEIVGKARAVVTLDSSVGVEALLNMRPVATLGRALYNVPGVARHVRPEERLADVLPELVGRPEDEDLVTKFLYFLRYEYLLPLTMKDATRDNVPPAAQRIVDVLDGRLAWARHPPPASSS
jgi:capsular polysaccharide export protein